MNAQVDIESIEKVGEVNSVIDETFIASGEQYLTFMLGNESYGINILSVKEISGWDEATIIPNSPSYVKGVVNMRGTIVPIIDLRIRFQVGESTYLPTTVVIILSGETSSGERTVGFIVDAVSDVLDIATDEMRPAPEFDGTVPSNHIYGLVNANESVVTVLDIEQLLSVDE
ncbi:MAG: chemotaxis protein CheW [Cellvibrionaceae bacterium]